MPSSLRKLFDATLPELLTAAPEAFGAGIGGPVLFEISGPAGGTWVVDFRQRTVTQGVPEATVRAIVRAAELDFLALIEGRMTIDDGILTQRVQVAGDVAALAHLFDALHEMKVRI